MATLIPFVVCANPVSSVGRPDNRPFDRLSDRRPFGESADWRCGDAMSQCDNSCVCGALCMELFCAVFPAIPVCRCRHSRWTVVGEAFNCDPHYTFLDSLGECTYFTPGVETSAADKQWWHLWRGNPVEGVVATCFGQLVPFDRGASSAPARSGSRFATALPLRPAHLLL